ncbi:o-succinylbenzoate synthase [Acidipropionibacterium acidipropionici]|uniref:o-succinylbenzoate synthase n=1 Tax=Acidipropionibacterium acidipropionici TaxID=1748 RepID=UPI00110B8EEA|nr:o-succinylbenzoate synthase [Acidipropionibacterium acidipropionici]QCV96244.1 o-succinylbenzoate synthase [Acidipropionibacterium acidipropionici]
MRITRARLFEVRLPLVHRFTTSSHAKSSLDHILVELTDESGATGWGEIASPAGPYYCSETTETAWLTAIHFLLPAVLDAEWEHPEQVDRLWARVRGHEFAKAGVVGAAWDLWTRSQGVPLASALGGTRERVRAGVSLGIEATIDELLAQVERQVEAGYHRVKLKISHGWDVEPVAAVRSAYPELDLHVDANGVYESDDETIAHLGELDRFGLTMIEQPFAPRDLLGSAALQARISTDVCLDESVVDLHDLELMIALKAGRVLNIKVSRMGGLTVARDAHDRAIGEGIPVWCGGMHEFGIGRAANVAISSLPGFTLPSDVSGSDKYYSRDVIAPPVIAHDGWVDVPEALGLGHDVDRDWIDANTLRRFDSAEPSTT